MHHHDDAIGRTQRHKQRRKSNKRSGFDFRDMFSEPALGEGRKKVKWKGQKRESKKTERANESQTKKSEINKSK